MTSPVSAHPRRSRSTLLPRNPRLLNTKGTWIPSRGRTQPVRRVHERYQGLRGELLSRVVGRGRVGYDTIWYGFGWILGFAFVSLLFFLGFCIFTRLFLPKLIALSLLPSSLCNVTPSILLSFSYVLRYDPFSFGLLGERVRRGKTRRDLLVLGRQRSLPSLSLFHVTHSNALSPLSYIVRGKKVHSILSEPTNENAKRTNEKAKCPLRICLRDHENSGWKVISKESISFNSPALLPVSPHPYQHPNGTLSEGLERASGGKVRARRDERAKELGEKEKWI